MDTYQKNSDTIWVRLSSFSFIFYLILIQIGTLNAQVEVEKEDLPKSIVSAIETDFISCSDKISWKVADKSFKNPNRYVAKAKGKNVTCEATYDGNGHLLYSKTIMSNVKLPSVVHEAIKNEFPGWRITGDQAVIRNFNENTKYYQVFIQNESGSKSIFYKPTGEAIEPPSGTLEARTVEISKEDVPQSVVNAIETDYLSCKENVSWRLDDKRTNVDRYVATAKGQNITCEAVYDKNGKLIRSKTVANNVKLPSTVLETIKSEYPGWRITGDQAVIRNFDNNTKYFEIYLEKEGSSMTVFYNTTGKKVKPKYS